MKIIFCFLSENEYLDSIEEKKRNNLHVTTRKKQKRELKEQKILKRPLFLKQRPYQSWEPVTLCHLCLTYLSSYLSSLFCYFVFTCIVRLFLSFQSYTYILVYYLHHLFQIFIILYYSGPSIIRTSLVTANSSGVLVLKIEIVRINERT